MITGRLIASKSKSPDVHKRGSQIAQDRRVQRRTIRVRRDRTAASLMLAGVAVAAMDETKHFKLIGTTGTGKSTAIRELLAGALERGDRAVITDPDGGYVARFYDRYRGDVILNPFEPYSVKWDLFAEIHNPYDVEQLASGLIPSTEDSSGREWRGYARTFLTAVALPSGRPARPGGAVALARGCEQRGAAPDCCRHPRATFP